MKERKKREIDLAIRGGKGWQGSRFLPKRDKIIYSKFHAASRHRDERSRETSRVSSAHDMSPRTPVENVPPERFFATRGSIIRARRAIRTPTKDFSSVLRRSRKWRGTHIVPSPSSSSSTTTTTMKTRHIRELP